MNKFYPCLVCGNVEKSIQTFFCDNCETTMSQNVKDKCVEQILEKEYNSEDTKHVGYW